MCRNTKYSSQTKLLSSSKFQCPDLLFKNSREQRLVSLSDTTAFDNEIFKFLYMSMISKQIKKMNPRFLLFFVFNFFILFFYVSSLFKTNSFCSNVWCISFCETVTVCTPKGTRTSIFHSLDAFLSILRAAEYNINNISGRFILAFVGTEMKSK